MSGISHYVIWKFKCLIRMKKDSFDQSGLSHNSQNQINSGLLPQFCFIYSILRWLGYRYKKCFVHYNDKTSWKVDGNAHIISRTQIRLILLNETNIGTLPTGYFETWYSSLQRTEDLILVLRYFGSNNGEREKERKNQFIKGRSQNKEMIMMLRTLYKNQFRSFSQKSIPKRIIIDE